MIDPDPLFLAWYLWFWSEQEGENQESSCKETQITLNLASLMKKWQPRLMTPAKMYISREELGWQWQVSQPPAQSLHQFKPCRLTLGLCWLAMIKSCEMSLLLLFCLLIIVIGTAECHTSGQGRRRCFDVVTWAESSVPHCKVYFMEHLFSYLALVEVVFFSKETLGLV